MKRFSLVLMMSLVLGGVATESRATQADNYGLSDLSALPVHCIPRKTKRMSTPMPLWGGGNMPACTGDNFAIYAPIATMGKIVDLYIHPDDFLTERFNTACFFDRSAVEGVIRKLIELKICDESSTRNGASGTRVSEETDATPVVPTEEAPVRRRSNIRQ